LPYRSGAQRLRWTFPPATLVDQSTFMPATLVDQSG
jgi:hypothetical protein